VGIGCPEMVKGSWIKPGAVVIDCGINSIAGMSFSLFVQDQLQMFFFNGQVDRCKKEVLIRPEFQ
jgi:5,10-methylene-tetrahydrofolate dehydrogenase/methenyl tetrahydrofolate cyclohydrolase